MPPAVNVPAPQRILIVRTDRIGDVVLSLPMIPILKSAVPESSLAFLLRSSTQDLVAGQRDLETILTYDRNGIEKPFGEMLKEIRANRFDAVVVTYPTFRLAMLMFVAGIPVRVGTGYRWYSFLFNMRVFEHRKTAEKHEAEYNVSLLRPFGVAEDSRAQPSLVITEVARQQAAKALEEMNIGMNRPIAILHPGSGGSARDWPAERFGQLAALLVADGMQVIVTGGPGEDLLLKAVSDHSGNAVKLLASPLPLMSLAALIERSHVFVSNSTGPLHVAAAVGTPVVAFYPPILQCSSKRWGPLTPNRVIFEPLSKNCPRCKGGACQANECLAQISAAEVARAVRTMAGKKSSVGGS
jgi:heptosyltransferase-2